MDVQLLHDLRTVCLARLDTQFEASADLLGAEAFGDHLQYLSVTEHTREIGICLAIGALENEVLLQFLIEAVVLSAFGGLVGIALALVACLGLSALLNMPFLFNPGINLMSFGFSAAIGVIFGYVPARRAAQLDPIEALRHE